MLKKQQSSKLSRPALVPLHGFQDKQPRFLDRDSIVIGRARGCDIRLDAPDISNLQCVISRSSASFRIRDCGSRSGTKINGEGVKSAILQDGDVLQLGLFSFTVRLPLAHPGQFIDAERFHRAQRSRQHLAQLALKLRRKLINMYDIGAPSTPTELSRKALEVKAQIRTYDQRLSELEQSERELEQERDKLRKEQEAHQQLVQQVQLDLSRRLDDAEREIRTRWLEFQKRCQQEEAHLKNMAAPFPSLAAN